jgi:hypothetical protein
LVQKFPCGGTVGPFQFQTRALTDIIFAIFLSLPHNTIIHPKFGIPFSQAANQDQILVGILWSL